MTLRQLKYFQQLAKDLNFHAAAERLHVAQSALTRQVQLLEKELDVKLLTRDRRGVKVTSAGRTLLRHAHEILFQVDRAATETRRTTVEGDPDSLRLAFIASASHVLVPMILKKIRQDYPHLNLELRELSTKNQFEELARSRVDVGLVRPPRGPRRKEIIYQPLLIEPFVVAVAEDHPLANKRNVRLKAFADDSFIMHSGPYDSVNTTIYDLTFDLLRQAGLQPKISHESPHKMLTALGLVKAGFGVALVPRSVMLLSIAGLNYTTLREKYPCSEIGLAWRQADDNPICNAFVQAAIAVVDELLNPEFIATA